MGDLIPFRKRSKPRKWTRPEDYGRVLPTETWQGRSRRSRWRWLFTGLRPWMLLVLLLAAWKFSEAELVRPLPWLATKPEKVAGDFTRCGQGRGAFCVIDGDTFKLGDRSVRVLGIDAPEMFPPRCAAEAQQGERATAELQRLLNQGPFEMVGQVHNDSDQYGRSLRALERRRADGTVQNLAEDLLATRTVRRYAGGARAPWC